MNSSAFSLIRNEIPSFLHRKILSASFCAFDKDTLNVLVLSFERKLFLVRQREIISEISLNSTIFSSLDFQDIVPESFDPEDDDDEDCCTAKEVEDVVSDFRFEKFVLNDDLHGKKIFILIKIQDKLVVLLFSDSSSLQIVKQLEEVADFIVLENPKYSYKERVQILFHDERTIETNFSKIEELCQTESSDGIGEFKNILKVLENSNKKLRIELQEYQEETKRRYILLKNQLIFGRNILRSNDLSEKLPLVRYGDTWIRLSSDGKIFIGIPLQQNYTSSEKKIKNVRVFVSGEMITQEIYGSFSTWDLNSSNHVHFDEFLTPGSNFVIVWSSDFLPLIKNSHRKYIVFVLYDVFDEKGSQYFLQFQAIKVNLNGDFLTSTHLQMSSGTRQDLLSIATTTKCWNLTLHCEEERYFKDIFDVLKDLNFEKYTGENFFASQEYEQQPQEHFFNKVTTSMWFGVLVSITKRNSIKIYSDFESKALALIRTIEDKSSVTIEVVSEVSTSIEHNFENCFHGECELLNIFKDKIRNQPSTSRGNGIVKVSVKELQKLTDLQLASDLEYKRM